jgi:transcriptional regulator with XRE-family HTH domain
MRADIHYLFKIAREGKKLTQRGIAKQVGIHCSTLSHFEAGEPQIDVQTLLKIAPLLSINPDFLIESHHNPFRSAHLIKIFMKDVFFIDISIFRILLSHNKNLEFISLIPHIQFSKARRHVSPNSVFAVLIKDDLQNIFIVRNKKNSTSLFSLNEGTLEARLTPLIPGNVKQSVLFREIELNDAHIYDLIGNHWVQLQKDDVIRFFPVDKQRESKILKGVEYLIKNKYTLEDAESLLDQYKYKNAQRRCKEIT